MSQIKGKVVRIFSDTMLAVNVGSNAGVTKGTRFTIHSEPVEVADTDGTPLGSVWFSKGRVIATGVFEKFSIVETERALLSTLTWPEGAQYKLKVQDSDLPSADDPESVKVGDVVVEVEKSERTAQTKPDDTQESREQETRSQHE